MSALARSGKIIRVLLHARPTASSILPDGEWDRSVLILLPTRALCDGAPHFLNSLCCIRARNTGLSAVNYCFHRFFLSIALVPPRAICSSIARHQALSQDYSVHLRQ